MNDLLKALRPSGARRGPRRPGVPWPIPQGTRRAARGNWLVGEAATGPEADALAIDLLLGYDPRERFL